MSGREWDGGGGFNLCILWKDGKGVGCLEPMRNPDAVKCLWLFRYFDGRPGFTVGPFHQRRQAMEAVDTVLEES